MNLAECLVDDETCPKGPTLAKLIVDAVRNAPNSKHDQLRLDTVGASFIGKVQPHFTQPSGRSDVYSYWFGYGETYRCDRCTRIHRRIEMRNLSVIGDENLPIDFPSHMQSVVEYLRWHRSQEFWGQYLRRVEQNVRRQLSIIEEDRGGSQELLASLHELNEQSYKILDDAVVTYAESQGWRAELRLRYGVRSAPSAPDGVPIIVTSKPFDADIYYLSGHEWDRAKKYGFHRSLRNWRRLGRTRKGTLSTTVFYPDSTRFCAVFPKGIVKQSKPFTDRDLEPLEKTPDSESDERPPGLVGDLIATDPVGPSFGRREGRLRVSFSVD